MDRHLNSPPWSCRHLEWLVDSGIRLETSDGQEVEIWDYKHTPDSAKLSAWAVHFRNHYCSDHDIDDLKESRTRAEYLTEIKFPTITGAPGPAIRAGDFTEILFADYLEHVHKFWVPRLRWSCKVIRNESSKGCDMIGFKVKDPQRPSSGDVMVVCEAKAKFSRSGSDNRLQKSIQDSAKDPFRVDESLNYLRQRFRERDEKEAANIISRFQNPIDRPYLEEYRAGAFYTDDAYDDSEILTADASKIELRGSTLSHPKIGVLKIFVFKGPDMMNLVNDLYKRAADEA